MERKPTHVSYVHVILTVSANPLHSRPPKHLAIWLWLYEGIENTRAVHLVRFRIREENWEYQQGSKVLHLTFGIITYIHIEHNIFIHIYLFRGLIWINRCWTMLRNSICLNADCKLHQQFRTCVPINQNKLFVFNFIIFFIIYCHLTYYHHMPACIICALRCVAVLQTNQKSILFE